MSSKNSKEKSANKPKQARSKRLVEDVLQAGAQIFERIQFENITTNKIAEIAGVSVGSLYQYFSNKTSLFSVIMDRRLEENRTKLGLLLKEIPEQEFESFVREFVDQFLDHLIQQKGYLRALIYFQFELKKNTLMIESRMKMAEILATEFSNRYAWLKNDERLKSKFFFLINSGFGIVYLYSQSDSLPISLDQMKDELTMSAVAYLRAKN